MTRNSLDTAAGPGDWFTGSVYNWHGAVPTRFMTHVAIQQADDDGNVVNWGEHVTDEEYASAPDVSS